MFSIVHESYSLVDENVPCFLLYGCSCQKCSKVLAVPLPTLFIGPPTVYLMAHKEPPGCLICCSLVFGYQLSYWHICALQQDEGSRRLLKAIAQEKVFSNWPAGQMLISCSPIGPFVLQLDDGLRGLQKKISGFPIGPSLLQQDEGSRSLLKAIAMEKELEIFSLWPFKGHTSIFLIDCQLVTC